MLLINVHTYVLNKNSFLNLKFEKTPKISIPVIFKLDLTTQLYALPTLCNSLITDSSTWWMYFHGVHWCACKVLVQTCEDVKKKKNN